VDRVAKRRTSPNIRHMIRKRIVENLLNEGKIPFDQIAQVSAKLMENERVRSIVCNRIQFLFKDEFQDTDIIQLKIFDGIRKGKKTQMYSVGDPEQYILGFTYDLRGVSKPSFDKIPINRFVLVCNECQIDTNRRACDKLVRFTNHFHTCIRQVSEVGADDHGGVFFIRDTDLDAVIPKFIELTNCVFNSCQNTKRLFLGYENKTFDGFIEKYGLVPISNEHRRPITFLGESLELLSSAMQMSCKRIIEEYGLDKIRLRKLGIRLIKAIISGSILSGDSAISFIKNDLGFLFENESINLDRQLDRLVNLLCPKSYYCGNHFYSSIHKAKGLEADCVLMVAKDNGELRKWLETDYEERRKDIKDICRVGYVGFTSDP
jgi:DNA helicase-2/ATP-dependent DNA helicase PcrA